MSTPTGAGSRARRRVGALAVGLAVSALALTGCTSAPPAHHAAEEPYGTLPTWLPTDGAQADGVLTADVHHPAVTSEGDSVEVHIGGASVLVDVVGPEVPGEGLPVQPEDTTCTWIVTMSRASAPVAISAAEFNTLDHLGTVYRVAPLPGGPAIPKTLRPGEKASFALRAAMPTGEGVMRFSGGTDRVLASWDFVVEND